MICKKCNNQLPENSDFCPNCGQKKAKSNKLLLIVVGIGIFVCAFSLGIFVGNRLLSHKDNAKCVDSFNNTNQETTDENYTFNLFDVEKIKIENAKNNQLNNNIVINNIYFNPNYISYGEYRKAYVYGRNNNSEPVHINIVVYYYDGEGYQVKKDAYNTYVYANNDFVVELPYIRDDSIYKTVKIAYEATKIKSYETNISSDEFEMTISPPTNSKGITAYIKNNSSQDAYLGLSCIYYKDGKVVFVDSRSIIGIATGEIKENTFLISTLKLNDDYKNPQMIEYDDYKIFVHGAYNSDSDNY